MATPKLFELRIRRMLGQPRGTVNRATDAGARALRAAGLQTHIALNGRVKFFLKENPEKKVFHTVQVEKNDFIHTMLIDTPLESRGYEYLG